MDNDTDEQQKSMETTMRRRGTNLTKSPIAADSWLLSETDEQIFPTENTSPTTQQENSLISYDDICLFCKQVMEALAEFFSNMFQNPSISSEETPSPIHPDVKQRMDQFRVYATTGYDTSNVQHEEILQNYWNICCPEEELESRKSQQWKKLGFQGTDPASDFRGVGIFGLRCLVYFASTYPNTFKSMLRGHSFENKEQYPFSIAGFNVIMIIFEILGWGFKRTPQNPTSQRNLIRFLFETCDETCTAASCGDLIDFGFEKEGDFSSTSFFEEKKNPWDIEAGIEFASIENMFFELFCYSFSCLDSQWYGKENVSYMDFPVVLQNVTQEVNNFVKSNSFTFSMIMNSNQSKECNNCL